MCRREAGGSFHRLCADPLAKWMAPFTLSYGVCADEYAAWRSQALGRDLAALLAHRRTVATLRDLSHHFGLSHPDSVSNLIRRAENALAKSKTLQSDLKKIDDLLNT